jgi:Rrf2 family protein
MLLSQTGKYAVRAVIHLAQQPPDRSDRVGDIAEALGIPKNYLSKILHQLTRAGLLLSERGPKGGFRLAVAPEALSLADIIEAVDPGTLDPRCLLGLPECSEANPCPLHDHWKELAARIGAFLDGTKLSDLSGSKPGSAT